MLLRFTHLNDKGFALATTEDGKQVACLGVLPGETAEVEIWGKRKGLQMANLLEVTEASDDRIVLEELAYTSTAPLAIASREWEHTYKHSWILDQFTKHEIFIDPNFDLRENPSDYHYRNKVEYSFYSDENGLHLAFHKRNTSKGKIIVEDTKLVFHPMNTVARKILEFLREHNYTSWDLKSLIIRGTQTGECVAAVFCKEKNKIQDAQTLESLMDEKLTGIVWVYSDHRAPDSRITAVEHSVGSTDLTEHFGEFNTLRLVYPWHGFFQVNPLLFNDTLRYLRTWVSGLSNHSSLSVLDLYAGVGTLGIALADKVASVHCVELSDNAAEYTLTNAQLNELTNVTAEVLKTEDLPDEVFKDKHIVIVDPPRSGLMPQVITKILAAKPDYIVYLSCNPATQARDLKNLLNTYTLQSYTAYNYYPRTMHVEGLAILKRK